MSISAVAVPAPRRRKKDHGAADVDAQWRDADAIRAHGRSGYTEHPSTLVSRIVRRLVFQFGGPVDSRSPVASRTRLARGCLCRFVRALVYRTGSHVVRPGARFLERQATSNMCPASRPPHRPLCRHSYGGRLHVGAALDELQNLAKARRALAPQRRAVTWLSMSAGGRASAKTSRRPRSPAGCRVVQDPPSWLLRQVRPQQPEPGLVIIGGVRCDVAEVIDEDRADEGAPRRRREPEELAEV